MAIQKKPEFNAPSDLREERPEAAAAPAPSAAVVSASTLAGTWTNCDRATRGIVKIIITASGANLTVQAFGACSPTPCDWGKVKGLSYAADVSSVPAVAFSAIYKFSFKETILVGVLDNGSLIVETFNNFTDGSGRSDYYSKAYLCKH
jgi:hypothetical protein